MRRSLVAFGFALGLAAPAAAHAASRCPDQTPRFEAGAKFAGEVRHVIDGQTLCVGRVANPDTWIRVRLTDLADIKQPTGWWARGALRRVALGKYAVCTVSSAEYATTDPAPAVCRVAGVSVAGRVKRAR